MKRHINSSRHLKSVGRAAQAAAFAIEQLECRRLLSAGFLDQTFNQVGKIITSYRSTSDGVAVALQADQKAVVVGDTQQSGATKDAFVSRYNVDGSKDTTFGSGGVTFLPNLGAQEIATGVTVQSDQKIVICGLAGDIAAIKGDFFVARFNTDGTLDTTFNSAGAHPGILVQDMGGLDAASDVKIVGSHIVVVGISTQSQSFLGQTLPVASGGTAVLVLNSDGTVASSNVGSNDVGTIEGATAMALTQDGGFVVSGFQVKVTAHQSGFGIGLGATSKVMAEFFNADGTPNDAIGDGGKVFADFGKTVQLGVGVAVDPNSGAVVVAGAAANGVIDEPPGFVGNAPVGAASISDYAVAKFTSTGALDTSFNTTGMQTVDFLTGTKSDVDGASDVVIQSDGKIVVSGGTKFGANVDFATARLNTDGSLDSTFGAGGKQRTDFGGSDGSFGMTIMPDDRVIEVGHTKANAGSGSVAILRYTNDGQATPTAKALVVVNSLTVGKLPTAVIGGVTKGTVTAAIQELGDLAATGAVTITVYMSSDGVLDGSDKQIGQMTKSVKLGVGGGLSVPVPVKFQNPAADGDFTILATITSVNSTPPVSTAVTAAGATVHVQHAHIDVAGTLTPQANKALKYKKKVPLKVPLTNNGNVQAKGTATFDVFVSSTADLTGAIGTPTTLTVKNLVLNAGKSGKATLLYSTPASASVLAAGSYFLVIRLTSSTFTPANSTDGNLVAVIPITIA